MSASNEMDLLLSTALVHHKEGHNYGCATCTVACADYGHGQEEVEEAHQQYPSGSGFIAGSVLSLTNQAYKRLGSFGHC